MGYLTAHGEEQSYATAVGFQHNKADLIKGGRLLKSPSTHGVPAKGAVPKVTFLDNSTLFKTTNGSWL